MGCGGSVPEGSPEQIEANKEAERIIREGKKQMAKEVKLLLLGTGASGKSTLAKQMRIMFLDGFTDEKERSVYTELVYLNIIKNMKTLVEQTDKYEYKISEKNQNVAEELRNLSIQLSDVELTQERGTGIQNLWKDEAIKKTYERSNEFQLDDCCGYFFDNLERIIAPNYVPTVDDILNVRAKTTGITETVFGMGDKNKMLEVRMVDVGGQRNERKKWIHCFQDVTAIIFVIAASEYNQVLEEDLQTNRMHESLKLFGDIINNRWFQNTSIILFLNKKDLFLQKIAKYPLTIAFEDYKEDVVVESIKKDARGEELKQLKEFGEKYVAGMAFILDQLICTDNSENQRNIYNHQTCATDTNNIRAVWVAVQDIFMNINMNGNL